MLASPSDQDAIHPSHSRRHGTRLLCTSQRNDPDHGSHRLKLVRLLRDELGGLTILYL